MRKLLWIGDAGCDSGFAKCTHETLDVLRESWEVSVLGLNYRGDPHKFPYDIYPCWPGGDMFGLGRVKDIVQRVNPDLVLVQNDPWNLPAYLRKLRGVPVVASLAVDGKNCAGRGLNGLALAIFWAKFAIEEARQGGYTGPATAIPLGVDLETFYPVLRAEARKILGLPADKVDYNSAFIVGNVNRNQPRKRLDLTISFFAEWIKSRKVDNAFLYLHVAPTGDDGYDCQQLASHYGIADRLILAQPEVWHGASEPFLRATYSAFDVLLSTTQGEGWGLTAMEAMACGIPCVLPDWAAFGEWAKNTAILVPCSEIAVTPGTINVVGGIPDRAETINALDLLYRDNGWRHELSGRGLALVASPDYRWKTIGEKFRVALDHVMAGTMAVA